MKTGINNKNSGFSMVEVIIVIAIIAVMGSVLTMSVSVLSKKNVNKCAKEMVSVLERTRVLTLGKAQGDIKCTFKYDAASNSYHALIFRGGSTVSDTEIGSDSITITLTYADGTQDVLTNLVGNPDDSLNGVSFVYNRSSGAFSSMGCKKIDVSGSGKTIHITPIELTGKILVD